MRDQDPWDSPRLAAADLTEVAGMMRGLSALAVKRGRPVPLNDTSYTSEDLQEAMGGAASSGGSRCAAADSSGRSGTTPATSSDGRLVFVQAARRPFPSRTPLQWATWMVPTIGQVSRSILGSLGQ